jgi:UDP-N-acetylglucosamine 4,6-dehydratase/5-epimerase
MDYKKPFPFKDILITGGTGTFGKAFVKYARYSLPHVVLRVFSRDEDKQRLMREELGDDHITYMIGDVRDRDRLERAMRGVDLVIHAAALKQVPTGESNCDEFIKTNVLGSMMVGEAAISSGVKRVVFLSTDKAAYPQTAYGASKLIAERYFISANSYSPNTDFVLTRYGNIAGSRGSVIPLFQGLIESGRPLPVTNLDATRFWMNITEAIKLVIDAALLAERGEIFVPVLSSFSLRDLIVAMLGHDPEPKELKLVGLRNSEKVHETLMTAEELRRARTVKSDSSGYASVYAITDHIVSDEIKPYEYNSNSGNFVQCLSVKEIRGML